VFTIASGAEIILIPLAPTGVTIHQGIAGVGSWLAGALLIVSGVLMWLQPQQRSFFGVLAVLLALVSFVTSNLGGFVIGMLLGLVGGGLGFAWAPDKANPDGGEDGTEPGGPDVGKDSASRYLGLALVPAMLATGLMGAPARQAAATGCNWFTSVFGCKAPSPSSSPAPAPSATPQPGTSNGNGRPGGTAGRGKTGPCPSGTPPVTRVPPLTTTPPATALPPLTTSPPATTVPPRAGIPCAAPKNCPAPKATPGQSTKEIAKEIAKAAPCVPPGKARSAPAGQAPVSADPATLNASSLRMSGLHYDGVVELPTAAGTPVKKLRFSMKHAVLGNVDQHIGRGTRQWRLRAGTLTFDGGVVMYTTKMKSKVFGALPLTFTPEHPPPLVPPSMVMTDVVSEQPTVIARSAALKGLDLSL
jgi:hypothetical protein